MGDPIYTFVNDIIIDCITKNIIGTPEFLRLKGIRQSGITGLFTKRDYNRYEHSLGVYYLLRHVGASIEQCIGGLIHDIYHTNFSHTTDELFCGESQESFHEKNKYEFFNRCCTNIISILKQNFPTRDATYFLDGENMLITKSKSFGADMIDYFLRDGYYENILTLDWITSVVSKLKYVNQRIVLCDVNLAREFCQMTVKINEVYMSPFSRGQYKIFMHILKIALNKNIITKDQIVYGNSSDEEIYKIICGSQCSELSGLIQLLETTLESDYFYDDDDTITRKKKKMTKEKIYRKLRYLDPVCCQRDECCLVSELDDDIVRIVSRKKVQFTQTPYLCIDTDLEVDM